MKYHLKNILIVLLAMTLVLSLCACGSKANETTPPTTQIEVENETQPSTGDNADNTDASEGTEPPTPSDTESGVGGKGEEGNDATKPSVPSNDDEKHPTDDNDKKENESQETTPPTTNPKPTEPDQDETETTTPPDTKPNDNENEGNKDNENENNNNDDKDETTPPTIDNEETKPPVVIEPPVTEPEEPTAPDVKVTKEQINQIKVYFLELVNNERSKKGVGALSTNSHLTSCAQTRSAEVVSKWSHTRPDGTQFYTIIDTSQYAYTSAGENLCMTSHVGTNSYTSLDAWTGSDAQIYDAACWIFTTLKNSPTHYSSMINATFKDTGIGISYILDEASGIPYFYVAQLFGTTEY